MVGKQIRLRQFTDEQQRCFILAIDQVIPQGLHPALSQPVRVLEQLSDANIDAFLLHAGIVKLAGHVLAGGKPFLLKLTTATTQSKDKTHRFVVDRVEHAVGLGAAGVAMNLFVGSPYEALLFEQFSEAVLVCEQFGMPMLAMAHPMPEQQYNPALQAYACRVAAELGADIVKTDYPGSMDGFRFITENCPAPVLVEESPYSEDQQRYPADCQRSHACGGQRGTVWAACLGAH